MEQEVLPVSIIEVSYYGTNVVNNFPNCFSTISFATKFSQQHSPGIVQNGFNGTGHEKRNNARASLVVIRKTCNLIWTLQSKVDFPDDIPIQDRLS